MNAVKHPAPFSDAILDFLKVVVPPGTYLDPFCGIGKVFALTTPERHFVGIELEPEWASVASSQEHGLVWCGDSLKLMEDAKDSPLWDGIVTSPVYGNRMSDSHNAADESRRRSYTHTLGRKLSEGNIGDAYFWQPRYQEFHQIAWELCYRVTRLGGYMFLNVSDFIRRGEPERVVAWHMKTLREAGWTIQRVHHIGTPRFRHGENNQARVEHEAVIRAIKVGEQ